MTDTTQNAPASASSVVEGLFSLLEGAMGSSESLKTRTRLHLATTILSGISDEAASLLKDRFDTPAILTGIQRVETGLTEIEEGVKDVLIAVKDKKPSSSTAQVNPS